MNKWHVIVAGGPYLIHGKAHDYLQSDGRYQVALLPIKDVEKVLAYGEELSPHLCVVEWQPGDEEYRAIVRQCDNDKIEVLSAVSKIDLPLYLEQSWQFQKQFVLMPLNRDELVARVGLQLATYPKQLDAGMVRIDNDLAVNFELCRVRRGKNRYATITQDNMSILLYLYENINCWVRFDKLGQSYAGRDNISDNQVINRVLKIRNAVEDDKKFPRYILSNNRKMYMLHSESHPQVDPILGFNKTLQQARGAR